MTGRIVSPVVGCRTVITEVATDIVLPADHAEIKLKDFFLLVYRRISQVNSYFLKGRFQLSVALRQAELLADVLQLLALLAPDI